MQNSNAILVKNTALSNVVSNTSSNKSEVNAVNPAESPNSFQQMFSQQLQQEQANKLANQQQLNQVQASQNVANQQADMKAQEANLAHANETQRNAEKVAGDRKTQESANTPQKIEEKPTNQANQGATQTSKTQKDQVAKASTSNKKNETEDTINANQAQTGTNRKVTLEDGIADLKSVDSKLAKSKNQADEIAADEAVQDETQAKTTEKDALPQDLLQAATFANLTLVTQKTAIDVAKPVDATPAANTNVEAVNANRVNTVGAEKGIKTALTTQTNDASNLAGFNQNRNKDIDQNLDQNLAQVDTKTVNEIRGEKADAAKQNWLDGAIGKTAQMNSEKTSGSFAENLAEKALQTNMQFNVQSKVAEQFTNSANLSPISAYQANALNATSSANGTSNYIGAYPGKTGWDQAISQKVVWMVGAGEQSATLNLNPPDLGPLQVVINVNNDKADTTFISQNVEVRKALEEGMSTLRDMMGQAGVELGQTNVSTNSQAQQSFEEASKQANRSTTNISSTNPAPEQLRGTVAVARVANGLVDTFA